MYLRELVLTQVVNILGFKAQLLEIVQSLAVNLLHNTAALNANQDSDFFLTEAANKAQSKAAILMLLTDSVNRASDLSIPNILVSVWRWDAQKSTTKESVNNATLVEDSK